MADDPGHGPRRTWPERLAIVGTFASALICFIVAAALIAGYVVIRQRNIVDLQDPSEVAAAASANAAGPDNPPETLRQTTTSTTAPTTSRPTVASGADQPSTTGDVVDTEAETTTSAAPPAATFPEADPEAQNFLITGADNGACIDPDSPYYAGVRRSGGHGRAQRHDHGAPRRS